jgi:hypothetical protein
MAATISLGANLSIVNGSGVDVKMGATATITQSGTDIGPLTQTIGTTTEELAIGDITTMGYLYIKNAGANSVSFGLNTPVVPGTDAFATLLAGEAMVLPTRRSTIYGLADTSPVAIEMLLIEL